MDVEGFELDVLAGAENTLSLTPKPTWLVESTLKSELIPGGINTRFAEVFEIFWRHGYKARRVNVKRELVQPADVYRWVSKGTVDVDEATLTYENLMVDEAQNFLFCDLEETVTNTFQGTSAFVSPE
jgi:hypothetical protein